jgi:large repetitive protein
LRKCARLTFCAGILGLVAVPLLLARLTAAAELGGRQRPTPGGLPCSTVKVYAPESHPNVVVIVDDGTLVGPDDLNLARAAKYFYCAFADDRDFLFIFAAKNGSLARGYQDYYRSVRNDVTGIGLAAYDYSASYGSDGKLLGVANMNSVSQWSAYADPSLDLWLLWDITHELGHQWIAHLNTPVGNGRLTNDPNSSARSHWQPLLDTEASIMGGNSWEQVTEEYVQFGKIIPATFVSTSLPSGFSSLDKYLMGVYGPGEVRPFFRIEATSKKIWQNFAMPGNLAAGKRIDYTIDDIIEVYGARDPDHSLAQTAFKAAFVLIVQKGRRVLDASLGVVDYFRTRIPEHFQAATDERFWIDTVPVKK